MIRAIVFSATIAALICLWLDRPTPSRLVQSDYCVITYKAAQKNELGEWETGWATGFGLCSLQDIYRQI